MDANKIAQLRKFESIVKKYINEDYGTYLSDEKKQLLSSTVIPDNFQHTFTSPSNIQGVVTRLCFEQLFKHIICTKNISFSDGTKPSISYGEYLKNGLVVYFSKELAAKHTINIDEVIEFANNEEFTKKIKDSLQGNFYPLVFTADANAIMNVANNPELIKELDKDAVKKHIQAQKKAKEISNNEALENMQKKGKVFPPMYVEGIQYIKYIDETGQVKMFKTSNTNAVSQAYREMTASLNVGEELNMEKFFPILKKYGENVPLYTKSEINQSKLSSSESEMLDTIYQDESLVNKASDESMLHSNDMNVHLSGDSVAITNNNNNNNVSTNEFEETNATNVIINADGIKKRVITTEKEYLDIVNRSVNGHKLTDEELAALADYDRRVFGGIVQANDNTSESNQTPTNKAQSVTPTPTAEQPIQPEVNTQVSPFTEQPVMLKLKPNKQTGFAQKYLPLFVVIITIMIGVIAGISLFRIKGLI